MFGSKKEYIGKEDIETIIGINTKIKGSIQAKGSIRIDGELDGELLGDAEVVIGQTGKLKANIKAKGATIAGEVIGNVEIQDKLELLSTAKVIGDLTVGSIIIGEGAVFHGACKMKEEQVAGVKSAKKG